MECSGDWDGSNVHDDHLTFLRDTRRLPGVDCVRVHVPPAKGIFCSYFLRGFGVPASDFMRAFLAFYRLQLHHLTPNTVLLLSAFVTMCEGYLSVLPTIELSGAFFYIKLGTAVREEAAQCGAYIAVRRPGSANADPAMKLL